MSTETPAIELLEGVKVPRPSAEECIVATINGTVILPTTRMQDIAKLCAWLSCDKFEVFARIECVNGKPRAYLVRQPHSAAEFIPSFLRRQAE